MNPSEPLKPNREIAQYISPLALARISFPGLFKAEWIALFSVRYTYVTLLVGGFAAFGIAVLTAVSWSTDLNPPPLVDAPLQGLLFAQIAAVLIGASLYARENSSGSLRTQFSAAPRRVTIVLTKALALMASSFTLGAVLVALSLVASAAVYTVSGHTVTLEPTKILTTILGSGALLALTSVLGLAIATITRSEAFTVSIVLVLLVIVPTLLGVAGADQAWAAVTADLMFANATNALVGGVSSNIPHDVVVSAAWPAAALAFGAALVWRRDA